MESFLRKEELVFWRIRMKKLFRITAFLFLAFALLGCVSQQSTSVDVRNVEYPLSGFTPVERDATKAVEGTVVEINVFSTNDEHGWVFDWDFGQGQPRSYRGNPVPSGLSRVSTLYKEKSAEYPNPLLISAGDTIQGTLLSYYYNFIENDMENPMPRMMGKMGYSYWSPGNHEVEQGNTVANKVANEMAAQGIAVISANTEWKGTGEPYYLPYAVEEIEGVPPNIWGCVVHAIIEEFSKNNEFPLEDGRKGSYLGDFYKIIDDFFIKIQSEQLELSWRYKLDTIAKTFVDIMIEKQYDLKGSEFEIKYNNLRAIVDRVDKVDEGFNIIDYKTGEIPSKKDMQTFKDPQLLVESYLLEQKDRKVKDAIYWRLKGYGSSPIDESSMNKKDDFEEIKQSGFTLIEDILEYFKGKGVKFFPILMVLMILKKMLVNIAHIVAYAESFRTKSL